MIGLSVIASMLSSPAPATVTAKAASVSLGAYESEATLFGSGQISNPAAADSLNNCRANGQRI